MKANYGYKNGSGEYFITIDTERCNGCKRCVEACPSGVMEVGEDPNDPLSEKEVAFVTEEERKKIRYTCAPCKKGIPPCISSCEAKAITHSW